MQNNLNLLAGLLLLFSIQLQAQTPNRITIKGTIQDTLGETIVHATVMLLNPEDTTLVNFSRSDDKGEFSFKNVRNAPYLFKISYIGNGRERPGCAGHQTDQPATYGGGDQNGQSALAHPRRHDRVRCHDL